MVGSRGGTQQGSGGELRGEDVLIGPWPCSFGPSWPVSPRLQRGTCGSGRAGGAPNLAHGRALAPRPRAHLQRGCGTGAGVSVGSTRSPSSTGAWVETSISSACRRCVLLSLAIFFDLLCCRLASPPQNRSRKPRSALVSEGGL